MRCRLPSPTTTKRHPFRMALRDVSWPGAARRRATPPGSPLDSPSARRHSSGSPTPPPGCRWRHPQPGCHSHRHRQQQGYRSCPRPLLSRYLRSRSRPAWSEPPWHRRWQLPRHRHHHLLLLRHHRHRRPRSHRLPRPYRATRAGGDPGEGSSFHFRLAQRLPLPHSYIGRGPHRPQNPPIFHRVHHNVLSPYMQSTASEILLHLSPFF